MDILADLAGLPAQRHKCYAATLRRDHPELAEQFDRALESEYTGKQIAKWLTEHGAPVTGQTVNRHREGGCRACQTS